MTTTTTLRGYDQAEPGYVLLFDGISIAFTNRQDIADHLQLTNGQTLRTGLKLQGLQPRDSIDFRDTRLKSQSIRLQIEDFVGDLAALFATEADDETQLDLHIDADEDLTSRTSLHGKHVGVEAIGSGGERHRYPVPEDATWGFQHWGVSNAEALTLSPAPVTSSPIVWRGRRWGLYRVYREPLEIPRGLVFAPDLQTLEDPVSGLTGIEVPGSVPYVPRDGRYFDGTSRLSWASVEDVSSSAVSFAAWVRFDDLAGLHRIFQINQNSPSASGLVFDARSDLLRISHFYSTTNMERRGSVMLQAGVWYFVGYTVDGSGLASGAHVFLQGEEVSSYSVENDGVGTPNSLDDEWELGGTFGPLEGIVRMFARVWNRELSAAEFSSLYRNGWRPWSEAELTWWGELEDRGYAVGRRWTFEAAGKEAWLRKDMGLLTQRVPIRAIPQLDLPSSKLAFGGRLREYVIGPDALDVNNYGVDDFTTTLSGSTVDALRTSLQTAINSLAATAGTDGTWDNLDGRGLVIDPATGEIGIATADSGVLDDPTDTVTKAAFFCWLHREMWSAFGFDVGQIGAAEWTEIQDFGQAGLEPSNPLHVQFVEATDGYLGGMTPPGPGYVGAIFTTIPTNFNHEGGDHANNEVAHLIDNNGALRIWRPRYLGGTSGFKHNLDQGGQVVEMGVGLQDTTIAAQGQYWRPPASDPETPSSGYSISGAGTVNRAGLWLFFGKRRFLHSDDDFDEYQVAECSWVDGVVANKGLVQSSRLVISRWLDPRNFGFDRPPLASDWVVRANAEDEYSVHAVPLLMLGYKPAGFKDQAHLVIQRLLRTTGTSTGWSSFADDAPTLDAGDNEPTLAGFVRHDGEVADLGLAIPSSMIQTPIQWAAQANLLDPELLKMRLAVSPGMQTEDVLQGIMQPLGWCWSLVGNRYGVFSPYEILTQEDVDTVLTRSQKRGRLDGQIAAVGAPLRHLAPIDTFKLAYSWTPHLNKTSREDEHESPDKGRRYRPGGLEYPLKGLGLRHDPISGIPRGWRDRADEVAKWWERRHFLIENYPVMRVPGQDLAVGSVVRLTEPTATDPAGEYGVTGRIGRVVGVGETLETGEINVDILIQATKSQIPRVHAVSARGIGHDSSQNRIYTLGDWLTIGTEGWSDVAFFVEPTYEGLTAFGGNAAIRWQQWDRSGFRGFTGSGTVSSVGTENGVPYIQLTGAITGSYFRDMDTLIVFQPYDSQTTDSWVQQLFGVVAADDGEFGSGPTAGFPWEA